MIIRQNNKRGRIGLYSVGLQTYWAQFPGLRDRLEQYNAFIEKKLSQWGEVYNFGLIDNEEDGRKAGSFFAQNEVDIIFLHSATYFTASTALPAHQICKAPVVVLNLQPAAAMSYADTDTGEWLAHCIGCPVPEISNAFERAGVPFHHVSGLLGLEETPSISKANEVTAHMPQAKRAWSKIEQWAVAAGAKRNLQSARIGFLGNYYSGMLDMYSDFTQLHAKLGLHVEVLEMCDLDRHLALVEQNEINDVQKAVEEFFIISGDSPSDPIARKPTPEQMDWSCRVASAQMRMVNAYKLDGLSYYYHGSGDNAYEKLQGGFIVGHSLLTANGIPCAGEGDIKTNVAMKICDLLGTGGSYAEVVAMDYEKGTMIMGHDGPFHIAISDGKPVLRGMGIFHGKKGSGVSVEAHVITGPVTTLALTQLGNGSLRLIASEGMALNHPILTIGNTQTHIDFGMDLDDYMDEWFACAPTHHCAISVGHNAAMFEKVAQLLNVEFAQVGRK